MSVSTLPSLKLLRISTILYMVTALLAGLVAVTWNLPAEFAGSHTGLPVTQSFLYGIGTALSPPLSMLIIQFVLLLLTARKDRWGSFAILGLALIGLMTFIGALGEPINRIIFNPVTFDPTKVALMAGMILLPLAILILGILEWSRRQQKKREYASHFNS
jgi:hypothetical protein